MPSKSSKRWDNTRQSLLLRTGWLMLSCLWISLVAGQGQFHVQVQPGKTLAIHPQYPDVSRVAATYGLTWFPEPIPDVPWRRHHPKAQLGYSLGLLAPGNRAELGLAWTFMPQLRFTFWQRGDWTSHATYGTGLAYVSRTFHPIDNPGNIAMGARLNSSTLLELGLRHQPWSRLAWSLNLTAVHLSNANVRIPNLGLNILSAGLGLQYGLTTPRAPAPLPEASKGLWQPGLRLGRGFTGFKTPGGPTYPVWVGSVYMTRLRRQRLRWRAGLEAFHTESGLAFAQNQDIQGVNVRRDGWGLIAFGGAEFLFGPVALVAQLGPYLRRPFAMDFILYTKWGVQLYLKDQHQHPRHSPFIGCYVHAHSGEADFAELALGWLF